MFKRHLWPALQWICGSLLQVWYYLTRPFRRRSYSTELPLASPVVPSTPSFIQSQEPNFTLDAMRIFQLNDGPAQESHLARNKFAVQQMRNAPSHINRVASLSSTDPSPGFSLLTDVVENLVTSAEPDSPSLYSSPPSSPSSSLHTPCIVVSNPMGDIVSVPPNDSQLSDYGPQREPDLSAICQGEFPWPQHAPPEVNGLAKRRNFKGAPIITNISRDLLPFPTTRLSQGNTMPSDLRRQQSLGRPKSALAVVTDFVRASTHMPPRNISRETLVVSPESQAAFTQSSPFSAQAESFFIDDHLSSPPEFDIHNFGIYTDAVSTLNLQVPRRKRTAAASEPFSLFRTPTNNYEKPILAKEPGRECRRTFSLSTMTNTPHKRPRTFSDTSHLTAVSSRCDTPCIPLPQASHCLDVQEVNSPGLSVPSSESDNEDQRLAPVVVVDKEPTVPNGTSPYASLIFPFSLEDSVSWDTGSDFQHRGVDSVDLKCNIRHRFDLEEPVLTSVQLDNDALAASVAVLECHPSQYPGSSALSLLDHQCGNLLPIDTEGNLIGDDNAIFLSLEKCPVLSTTPSPVIDGSFFAGSTTFQTDSPLGLRNSVGLCDQQNDNPSDLREAPLRQVGILDGLFVSSGDSSVLPPFSESTFCVGGSQTFSSLMSATSDDCNTPQSVAVVVNSRRARRVGIYGPLYPPLATSDTQDDLVSDSEKHLSASEQRWSSSRNASRHVSALRPLVLPMRVAIRELSNTSAGDRSLERAPDILLQSNRNSIGFPPSYPLPQPPSYKIPSTYTTVASGFPSSDELDVFQKVKNVPALAPPQSFSACSSPKLEEPYLDSDGEDSAHAVNWGVAF